MATNYTKRSKGKAGVTLRARVETDIKNRLTRYRRQPEVQRSEGFIVRRAVEEFLNRHEQQTAKAA